MQGREACLNLANQFISSRGGKKTCVCGICVRADIFAKLFVIQHISLEAVA